MEYLPLFFRLRGTKVLVVGGGKVALRKIQVFVAAEADVTVISPKILPEIEAIPGLRIEQKEVTVQDIRKPYSLAILTTDNETLQAELADACRKNGIFVNRCDSPQESDFVTASLVDKPPVLAGITSSGSPGLSKMVKARFEAALEPALLELGTLLTELRADVIRHFSTQPEREKFFRAWTSEQLVERVKTEGIEAIRREILAQLA